MCVIKHTPPTRTQQPRTHKHNNTNNTNLVHKVLDVLLAQRLRRAHDLVQVAVHERVDEVDVVAVPHRAAAAGGGGDVAVAVAVGGVVVARGGGGGGGGGGRWRRG